MKRKFILCLAAILLAGCNSATSSSLTSSSNSNSIKDSSTSSSSSLLSSSVNSSSSSFSSVISSSSISSSEDNYYDFEFEESAKRLVLKSQNKTNIAYSSWEASYLEKGIEITTFVYDEDVFYGNIYNYGYDDNVEFLINVKNNESGWLVGGTYHFLINAEGNILFEVANSKSGLSSSMNKNMGVVLGENLKYEFSRLEQEKNGFTGYYSKVFIDYKFFGKENVIGNLSFCPGMRNSHNYMVDTNWSAYSERGCRWGSSSTFVLINQDGTFGERLSMDLDTLYFGDTIFDKSDWITFENDSLNEDVNNISSKGSTISYWKNELEYYKDSKIDKVVVYLGSNDITLESDASLVSEGIKDIINQLYNYFNNVKVYYVSMIITPSLLDYEVDIKEVNNAIKEYSMNSNLTYIDVNSKMYINNEIRSGLFKTDTSLNYLGYNILANEIHKALELNKNDLPEIFGSNSMYASSNSFKKVLINNEESVEGNGDKDQYLFFNKEPSSSFEVSTKINAKEVYNGDNYPKFGLALVGNNDTLFFYIDGSNALTKQTVGYVKGKNNFTWQWALSMESSVNINYSGDSFTELKAIYKDNNIQLLVNGESIFEVENFFETNELLSASILSFNTHLLLKDYYIK